MYKVKPYYSADETVSVPDTMYKMANVHREKEEVVLSSDSDPVSVLERKQEMILRKLQDLQKSVQLLKSQYQVPAEPKNSSTLSSTNEKLPNQARPAGQPCNLGDVVLDFVINADPNQVPYSLFVMLELLREKFKVTASSHVHSSVKSLPSELEDIFPTGQNRGDHQIIMTIIWKKVTHGPELMVDPGKQTMIQGEVNIIRYIQRLLDPKQEVEDIVTTTASDKWLDLVQTGLIQGSNKEKMAALRTMNSKLGQAEWLVGSSMSVVDVAAWSAIYQMKLAADLPGNVKKWFNACNNNKMSVAAKRFLS